MLNYVLCSLGLSRFFFAQCPACLSLVMEEDFAVAFDDGFQMSLEKGCAEKVHFFEAQDIADFAQTVLRGY